MWRYTFPVLLGGIVLITIPIWGMGLAVFLDSERRVLSRAVAPDGRRVAQIERLVVAGAPHIVVRVRSRWAPDWYLTGCLAASHYGETGARGRWRSDGVLEIVSSAAPKFWTSQGGPFRTDGCTAPGVVFRAAAPDALRLVHGT